MKIWFALAGSVALSVLLLTVVSCGGEGDKGLGSIEGIVSNSEGRPVSGVSVKITRGSTAFPVTPSRTDDQGYYSIDDVSKGTFQVEVSNEQGVRIGAAEVDLPAGEIATLNIVVSFVPSMYGIGQDIPNFETCEGFFGDIPVNLTLETNVNTETARSENPNVVAMCQVSAKMADGTDTITIDAWKFDSQESATGYFDALKKSVVNQIPGGSVQQITGLVGESLVSFGANAFTGVSNDRSIGNFVFFQRSVYVVQYHTSYPDGEPPPGLPKELVDFMIKRASTLNERLPIP